MTKRFVVLVLMAVLATQAFGQTFFGEYGYKEFAIGQNGQQDGLVSVLQGTSKQAPLTIIGTSNTPSYGLYRAFGVARYAYTIGFRDIYIGYQIEGRRGVYLTIGAPVDDDNTDAAVVPLDEFNFLKNHVAQQRVRQAALEQEVSSLRERLATKDTVILTDTSFSASFHIAIGGSGVVNITSREGLYGGGATTRLTIPAWAGHVTLFGAFDGTIISLLGAHYATQIATPTDDMEVFAQLGAIYASYPVEEQPARKWISPFTVGASLTYRLGSFGYIAASLDVVPNWELHKEYITATESRIKWGKGGISLFPAITISVQP